MAHVFEKASWIWRQGEAGRDEFCDFLDNVRVPAIGKRYYLHIASDSNYTVWINGQLCAFVSAFFNQDSAAVGGCRAADHEHTETDAMAAFLDARLPLIPGEYIAKHIFGNAAAAVPNA